MYFLLHRLFYKTPLFTRAYWLIGLFHKTHRALTNTHKTILFYPAEPEFFYFSLYKIIRILGLTVTTNIHDTRDATMVWSDSTYTHDYSDIFTNIPVINGRCHDISKEHVDNIFFRVFGYRLSIDPTDYIGDYVIKSNINSAHNARIAQGARKRQKGFVYLKLIDTVVSHAQTDFTVPRKIKNHAENYVMDFRVPVMKGAVPFVYVRYRPKSRAFSSGNTYAHIMPIAQVFLEDELKQILIFAQEMGLDYGELDIVRDNTNRKLYIVDVNTTPTGPPSNIKASDYNRSLRILSKLFATQFL